MPGIVHHAYADALAVTFAGKAQRGDDHFAVAAGGRMNRHALIVTGCNHSTADRPGDGLRFVRLIGSRHRGIVMRARAATRGEFESIRYTRRMKSGRRPS